MFQLICVLCQAPLPLANGYLLPSASLAAPLAAQVPSGAPAGSALRSSGGWQRTGRSLGAAVTLSSARVLRLNFTPSPTRCAPLIELAF